MFDCVCGILCCDDLMSIGASIQECVLLMLTVVFLNEIFNWVVINYHFFCGFFRALGKCSNAHGCVSHLLCVGVASKVTCSAAVFSQGPPLLM